MSALRRVGRKGQIFVWLIVLPVLFCWSMRLAKQITNGRRMTKRMIRGPQLIQAVATAVHQLLFAQTLLILTCRDDRERHGKMKKKVEGD